MTGSNLTGRGNLGTKRHVLTDNEGIPLSAVMSSASVHNVKLVTDVVDNAVAKRHISSLKTKTTGRKRKLQHLCLDKAYNSKPEEQAIAKRGYAIHLPYKGKKGEVKKDTEKIINRKKHPARRWVVERTNSWHRGFRKLFTRYEKRMENYLGLVQFS